MAQRSSAEKLLIKPGTTAWVSKADHRAVIEPLPKGAGWANAMDEATTAILFVDDEETLRELIAHHRDGFTSPDHVWFAYPKGGRSDINRDSLYPIVAEQTGMRPITQIALDETWSALRFRALKPGEPPFAPRR
jgi:hypothetical protein